MVKDRTVGDVYKTLTFQQKQIVDELILNYQLLKKYPLNDDQAKVVKFLITSVD